MPDRTADNNRIAKNTLYLYGRMLFTMLVTLYTSRVVLNALGASDYGLYNVVGGVVVLFSFLNSAMSSATQRYLNYDLARNDKEHLKIVFRTAIQIHCLIALVVLILAETIGLWFVCTYLKIPDGRMTAAIWVYQFSIFCTVCNIITLPCMADVIAHERMNVYAVISIIDVIVKLLVAISLTFVSFDKLIYYAFLLCFIQLLNTALYYIYNSRNFEEFNINLKKDQPLFKEMASFAGWSLWGNAAGALFTQGINILLNIFFGHVVNAARGIAVQVQSAVNAFVLNIQMAINPQITKSYAVGDMQRMHSLMFASSKICFFLLFFIVLPLSIEAKEVLVVWLKNVPDHTVWFLRLVLFVSLVDTLGNPYIIANQATGKVKVYQAVIGGILLMIVPIAYIVLKLGGNPESVFIVHLCIAIIAQVFRVLMMRPLIDLSVKTYLIKVIFPILSVVVIAPIVPFLYYMNTESSVLNFFIVCTLCVIFTAFPVYFLGLNQNEKLMVKESLHVWSSKLRSK
jgi:O-antigen/teichoic acid export membrane protein